MSTHSDSINNPERLAPLKHPHSLSKSKKIRRLVMRYGLALASSAVTIVVSLALQYYSLKLNLTLLVLVAVILPVWYGGKGPGFLAVLILEGITIFSKPIPPPDTTVAQFVIGHISVLSVFILLVVLVSSRERSEKLIKERNKLLQVTLASIGDAVIATDISGTITFLNSTAEQSTGWTMKEALGRSLNDVFVLIDETSRERIEGSTAMVLSKGAAPGETENSLCARTAIMVTRDGGEMPIDVNGSPIRTDSDEVFGVIFVFKDITERRNIENSLRRQALLIEQSSESIIVWDFDLGILEWNAGSEQLYGYKKEEVLGLMGHELLNTRFPVSIEDFILQLKTTGWWSGEVSHRTKSGLEVTVEARFQVNENQGNRIVLQTDRNISERKLAEKALKESEKRYRHLFENNPMPMWLYDVETLNFMAVNEAAITHYGYSKNEFLSMSIKDIRPLDALQDLLNDLKMPVGVKAKSTNWKHKKNDGTLIDVEISSHEETFQGRKCRLVLANDVTERLRAETQLNQLNETLELRVKERTLELEAANKELEAFSYSVSHDLRAPLRAIDGFSRIIVEDYSTSLDEEGNRLLQVIRTNAQSMGNLIDDLLAFSRLGRKPLEASNINMADLAGSVSNELCSVPGGRLIRFNINPIPAANGDTALLRQVFINLCSNAVKYSKTRESIEIEIGATTGSHEDVYYVRDQGVGFDMKYYDKLFGVFQRLHSPEDFEGTGVGLAIVHRIINRHGGRVWAEAEVDKGATFYFALPRVESQQSETRNG